MRASSLLTIDVGNTSTSFALFSLNKEKKIPTPKWIEIQSTQALSLGSLIRKRKLVKAKPLIMASSVVPQKNQLLRREIKQKLKSHPTFVTAKTQSIIKVRYRNPSEVGSDRIVNARGAVALTSGPIIVVDFGTATTFDCVSTKKEYLGGVIAPGPLISAEALYQKTAKLPLVVFNKPAKILGRNTLESIQSGLFHGYRGLVKEIVARLKAKLGTKTKVLTTGGQAHWMLKGLGLGNQYCPHLIHLGLYHYWKDGLKKK